MDAPSFGQLYGNLGAERSQSLIAVALSDGLNDEYSTKFKSETNLKDTQLELIKMEIIHTIISMDIIGSTL
jgi:hypothetical protein